MQAERWLSVLLFKVAIYTSTVVVAQRERLTQRGIYAVILAMLKVPNSTNERCSVAKQLALTALIVETEEQTAAG